jgi:hypothetical protein
MSVYKHFEGVSMKRISFLLAMLAMALALALAGCSNGSTESDSAFDKVYDVSTNAALTAAFDEAKGGPGKYLIKVSGDLTDNPGCHVGNAGVDITIRGTGSNKITWNYSGAPGSDKVFGISAAAKITLEKIRIVCGGYSANEWYWNLYIGDGGTLELKDGAVISADGPVINGGFYIDDNSTLIMSGGTIENFRRAVVIGGSNSTFTISKGTIRNIEYNSIAFFAISSGARVTVSGGEISGDIYIDGRNNSVTISGGKVSGHDDGVGVYVAGGSGHTVRKTGGTVTGGEGPYKIEDGVQATVTGF